MQLNTHFSADTTFPLGVCKDLWELADGWQLSSNVSVCCSGVLHVVDLFPFLRQAVDRALQGIQRAVAVPDGIRVFNASAIEAIKDAKFEAPVALRKAAKVSALPCVIARHTCSRVLCFQVPGCHYIIPVCMEAHWVFVSLFPAEGVAVVYDSARPDDGSVRKDLPVRALVRGCVCGCAVACL